MPNIAPSVVPPASLVNPDLELRSGACSSGHARQSRGARLGSLYCAPHKNATMFHAGNPPGERLCVSAFTDRWAASCSCMQLIPCEIRSQYGLYISDGIPIEAQFKGGGHD